MAPTVVILAAGQGTRMRSEIPKVLHPLCGLPMLLWPVLAAREAGAGRIVVVDGPERRLADHLPEGVELAVQEEPRGTGDAVRAAAPAIERDATVVVLNGDVPLVTAECVHDLVAGLGSERAAATVLTLEIDKPDGYGRIVRGQDGTVVRIAETKVPGDATPEELSIHEINAGIYAFEGGALLDALDRIEPANAQGEYYLTDTLPAMRDAGLVVTAHRSADPDVALGVNDRVGLAEVRAAAQRRIHRRHLLAGVTIVDPGATLIDAGVAIGRDTVIEPATFLRGATVIGERCTVGPATSVIDARIGDGATVVHSYLDRSEVGAGATVGPFTHLGPGEVAR